MLLRKTNKNCTALACRPIRRRSPNFSNSAVFAGRNREPHPAQRRPRQGFDIRSVGSLSQQVTLSASLRALGFRRGRSCICHMISRRKGVDPIWGSEGDHENCNRACVGGCRRHWRFGADVDRGHVQWRPIKFKQPICSASNDAERNECTRLFKLRAELDAARQRWNAPKDEPVHRDQRDACPLINSHV